MAVLLRPQDSLVMLGAADPVTSLLVRRLGAAAADDVEAGQHPPVDVVVVEHKALAAILLEALPICLEEHLVFVEQPL